METSIYISSEKIEYAVGQEKGGKITVKDMGHVNLPKDAVINGIIVDENAVKDAILLAQRNSNVPVFEKVRLCLGGNPALIKAREIPKTSEDNILRWMMGEFEESEFDPEDLVYDYAVIGHNEKKHSIALLCAMRKKILEDYMNLFQDIDIDLACIDVGRTGQIQLMNLTKSKENFLVLHMVGQDIDVSYYENGIYRQGNRSTINGPRGTEEAVRECAGFIDRFLQFIKTGGGEKKITTIYLAGMEAEKEILEQQGNLLMGINTRRLEDALASCIDTDDGENLGANIEAVGNFLTGKKYINLLEKYSYDPEKRKKACKTAKTVAPLIILLALFVGAFALFTVQGMRYNAQADEYEAYIAENSAAYGEVTAMQDEISIKADTLAGMQAAVEAEEVSLPGSAIDDINTAVGLGNITALSYTTEEGIVRLSVEASSEEYISHIAESIEAYPEFAEVDYSGYEGGEGNYQTTITFIYAR